MIKKNTKSRNTKIRKGKKKLLLEKKVKSFFINKTLTAQYMSIIYLLNKRKKDFSKIIQY